MALADQLDFFAATDVGKRRKHNEDSFLVDEQLGLFVVADGMGGHAAGEIASEIAVRTIHEVVSAQKDSLHRSGPRSETSNRQMMGLLEYAVQAASSRIHAEAKRDKRKRGMGTTISLLLVAGAYGYVAHVGDSRIYLVRGGKVQQITEDHTVANELVRLGMVTPEQLANVPRRNAITRAVGVYEHAEVDTLTLELLPDDQLLLSSDGLSSYLPDPSHILELLAPQDGERAVRALVDFANERGGKDNITAVLVRLGRGEPSDRARARRVQLKREVLAQMPLFARLSERELLRVMQIADVISYDEGDVIVREGENGDHMYVALQGRLQVTRGSAVVDQFGPGEHLGEMALIRSTPRSATVTALEPSELIRFSRRDFFEIIRAEPHLAVKLLWQFLGVLADRLDNTTRNLSAANHVARIERGEEPPTQPPLDSEERPTPVPDDPFAHPSRLPVSIAGPGLPFGERLDDSFDGEAEPRPANAPRFEDAPEMAHRIDDSPSWDSWDSWDNAGELDPATRKRLDRLARRLEGDDAPFDAKKTRPARARAGSWPDADESDGGQAPRRRHRTLQSAGSVPPPEASGAKPSKQTVPEGRLRSARDKALGDARSAPLPEGADDADGFRPTKVTLPMQPDESLKNELESLRAEFKQRLEKARRERNRKDSD